MEVSDVKVYDALIRVSKMNGRKESAESTMTLDDQAGAIRRAIKETGGRRGKTFEALDQSGFTIHRSDVYRQILDRVRSGKSDGIVVAYGDRLTRNWRAVGAFYDELEAAGAEVIVAGMPGVDYRTAAGRTMTGLMAVMSDAQYMTAKARGDAIADAVMARGVPNRVPYGYRRNADPVTGVKTDAKRDGKALVPDETTAPTVRRIFEMRGDGYAWSAIAKTLNDAGVPAPTGGEWVTSSLTSIIRNEAYTGTVTLGTRRVDSAHEPLVSATRWRRVQAARSVVRTGRFVAGIAGGLLECSGCGLPLSVIGTNKKSISYGCRRASSTGICSRPVYVSRDAADQFVHDAVRDVLSRGGVDLVSSARELEQARRVVEKARAERKAFAKFVSALDEDDFREGYEERRRVEAEAAHAYDELLAHASDADEMPTSPEAYNALDLTHQRRVAQSLIARVVVSPPLTRSVRERVIEDRFALDWKRAG